MAVLPLKVTLGLVLSWVIGSFLLLSGVGWAFSGALGAGVAFFLAGLVLLPPVHTLLRDRAGVDLSVGVRIALVVVLVIIAAKAAPTDDPWYQGGDAAGEEGIAQPNAPIRVCPGGERVPAGMLCPSG